MFAGAGGVHTLAQANGSSTHTHSGADRRADGSADRRTDSGADRRADSGADRRADSGADRRDDSSADGAAIGVADGDTGTIRSAQRSCDEATRATQFQRDAEGGTGRPAVWRYVPPRCASAHPVECSRLSAQLACMPGPSHAFTFAAGPGSSPLSLLRRGWARASSALPATAAVDKQAACGVQAAAGQAVRDTDGARGRFSSGRSLPCPRRGGSRRSRRYFDWDSAALVGLPRGGHHRTRRVCVPHVGTRASCVLTRSQS